MAFSRYGGWGNSQYLPATQEDDILKERITQGVDLFSRCSFGHSYNEFALFLLALKSASFDELWPPFSCPPTSLNSMATDSLEKFLEEYVDEHGDLDDDGDDLFTERGEGSTYESTPKQPSGGELPKEAPDGASYLPEDRTTTPATEPPLDGNHVFNILPPVQSGAMPLPSLHGPLPSRTIQAIDPLLLHPHPTPTNLAGRSQSASSAFLSHPIQQRSHSAAPTTSPRLSAPQGIAVSASAGPLHDQHIPKISGRRAVSATPPDTNDPTPVPSKASTPFISVLHFIAH